MEMAERKLRQVEPVSSRTWPEICQAFVQEVRQQVRGADSTKHDAVKRGAFLEA